MARISDDIPVDANADEMSNLGQVVHGRLDKAASEAARYVIIATKRGLIKEEAAAESYIRGKVEAAAQQLQQRLQLRLSALPSRIAAAIQRAMEKVRPHVLRVQGGRLRGMGVPPYQRLPGAYAPDQQDILGIGQGVMFPDVQRADYAVNPLSGLGWNRMTPGAEGSQASEEMFGIGQGPEIELSQGPDVEAELDGDEGVF